MERLTALRLQNFRSFMDTGTLELRPLTLLYGRNNAGKSALLRFFPLLGQAVREDAIEPLEPQDLLGLDYPDLVWRGSGGFQDGTYTIGITLTWASLSADYLLNYRLGLGEPGPSYIRGLEIRRGAETLFSARADESVSPEQARWELLSPERRAVVLPFQGLVPPDDTPFQALRELRALLLSHRGQLNSLLPSRTSFDREVPGRTRLIKMLERNGNQTVQALRSDPGLFDAVSRWYAQPDIDRRLDWKRVSADRVSLTSSPYRASQSATQDRLGMDFQVLLAEGGEGMASVLPVLVGAELAKRAGPSAILAIEEPESHLHADAQKKLGEHLCTLAAEEQAPTLVLETHSRMLLLGIQYAIAMGQLPPERVALYWIEQSNGSSSILRGVLNPDGTIQAWPARAFSEDRILTHALLTRQLELARQEDGR